MWRGVTFSLTRSSSSFQWGWKGTKKEVLLGRQRLERKWKDEWSGGVHSRIVITLVHAHRKRTQVDTQAETQADESDGSDEIPPTPKQKAAINSSSGSVPSAADKPTTASKNSTAEPSKTSSDPVPGSLTSHDPVPDPSPSKPSDVL